MPRRLCPLLLASAIACAPPPGLIAGPALATLPAVALPTAAIPALLLPATAIVAALPAAVGASPARALNVVDAQGSRRTTTASVTLPDGHRGTVTLTDLAPAIGVWFLVTLTRDDGAADTWHLENPTGLAQRIALDPRGLALRRDGEDALCDLWSASPSTLAIARGSDQVYAPVCDDRVYLRNATLGARSTLEWTTDFLRDHVWGGEAITTLAKQTVFADAQWESAELGGATSARGSRGGPTPASVDPRVTGRILDQGSLGLAVDASSGMEVGAWYGVHAAPGVWASVLEPRFVDPASLATMAGRTTTLDAVERGALVYSVAFDLSAFDLGFEIGTDHPRVDWDPYVPPSVRDLSLAGPDGFGSVAPLVRAGKVDPAFLPGLVSVFVGGFRRQHGAFKTGALSVVNGGSHYGFVEFGAELSHLQPGLATLVVWADGSVELRTWTVADAARIHAVRHARQNGVAILEPDPATGGTRPGALVRSWTAGNWSGSVEGELRSVRAGVCTQDTPRGRFLIYSYFSSATPSAMADVFASYGCQYAMLLDMNALEHTYLAIATLEGGSMAVHHLVMGMEVLDRIKAGQTYPRFVGAADSRDFFYVTRKDAVSR